MRLRLQGVNRKFIGAWSERSAIVGRLLPCCSEKAREMSAAVRRSAGGSGFPATPAGTSAGVDPVDVRRAADRAGSAPGAPTAPKRAIFVVESIIPSR